MSTKPPSKVRSPRQAGTVGILLFGLGGLVACSPYSTFKDVPTNCSVEDGYDFDTKNTYPFDTTSDASSVWGPSGDAFCTNMSLGVETMPDGPRCGSSAALVFREATCNDWGSLFGFSTFGPRSEQAYEGMSFWARSPGNTDKTFLILLDDANTASGAGICTPPPVLTNTQNQPCLTVLDQSGNTTASSGCGAPPLPDACGNSYTAVVSVTSEWAFYPIPWSRFTQLAQPNRVPNSFFPQTGGIPGTGLMPSALWNLMIRAPKGGAMELWIDNLSFYRKKGSVAGADAGSDALK